MTEAEFVRRSVEHQLGGVTGAGLCQDEDARLFAEAASSGGALSWNGATGLPHAFNNWAKLCDAEGQESLRQVGGRATEVKYVRSLAEMQAAGADFSMIVDMQDRRTRNLRLADGRVFPTFCFNRLVGVTDRVLWPLPLYHDIEDEGFLGGIDPKAVPWAEKDNRIVWRGIPGGRASPKGEVRSETVRLFYVLKRHAAGEMSREEALATISTFPRHRFVERLHADPRADVGFISRKGIKLPGQPLLSHLERPRVSRQDMQRSKYLAVVRGNDVASSLYWTMNSGSLALVMESPFETFGSCHFRPWEHYVPFREDMSDFDVAYDWCEAHPAECQAMAESAAEVCRLLARADLRQEIGRGVVGAVSRALRASLLV
jgi:hypothetical protein